MARTLWPRSSSVRVARSLAAHSILGLALGGLIYILAVTGTLSVFNREFQRWEQPAAPEMAVISPEAAEKAATAVFESEDPQTTHLYINFPRPDLPRTVITTDTQAFFATAEGDIAGREHFPWTQFLLDLHYYLHLPHILGLTVVGALGAFLVALSISGLLAHPRIFRDAFTFRRNSGRTGLADMHNRLSVWTAPFHISNALTGAILGLASVLAFAIAAASFGGDTTKVFSPVFGEDPPLNESPAGLAEIAAPIAYMHAEYPDLKPTFFILHDPGTAGQHVSVIAEHPNRLIFGDYYNFDADGVYLGNTGLSDGTAGQQVAGSVYNVHFGNWGGLPIKIAYFLFGLSLCTIIASGLNIYFVRRRAQARPAPRLEAGWAGIVWGTPATLALTLLVSVSGIAERPALVAFFWLPLVAIVTACLFMADEARCTRSLRLAGAALLAAGILLHTGLNAGSLDQANLIPVSVCGLMIAALLAASALRSRPGQQSMRETPAE
ncbi:PepSY-associated TM helix domain-containing protein [Hyphomonas jannaschiana]|uniref:PepSY-associated TM helix domain-containing protein n=1 Tax=Hyphomonas jannaschiana TaxID=86 RepID=UPI0035C74BA9